MPTNRYNGAPADTAVIAAGTPLFRILNAHATYASNSFNPTPAPLGDRTQGRYEPVDAALGGYIYVATSAAGAVAEGILRGRRIRRPAPHHRGLVQRAWLLDKKIAQLTLKEDVTVAVLHGAAATKLDLDTELLGGGRRRYSQTRTLGTKVLMKTPAARGLRYRCRNDDDLTSLMFVDRCATPPMIEIIEEHDVLLDPDGRDIVLGTLDTVFGLKYAGTIPKP